LRSKFKSIDPYHYDQTVVGALKYSYGYYFDGTDDKMSGSDAKLPAGATARTIQMWVKNLEPAGATGHGYLFCYGTELQYQWFGSYILNATADVYYSGQTDDFDTGINLDDSNWHFMEFKYDGTNVSVFDDLVEGSGSPTAKASTNTVLSGVCAIGCRMTLAHDFLKIDVNEFYVHNKLLTAAESAYCYYKTLGRQV